MLPEAQFFAGIDWAAEVRAVCVTDSAGKIAAQFTVAHSADGITGLVRRLARFGDPADVPVAIERPNGRLVDLLLEAGHPVVPVKPDAIKAWRDGEVLSDAGDAAVIAEYLRLRCHRLAPAAPCSDETRALRTVVRTRDDLVEMRVAATSQLAALLDAHWPGAKAVFADVESDRRRALGVRLPQITAAPPNVARPAGSGRRTHRPGCRGWAADGASFRSRVRRSPPGRPGRSAAASARMRSVPSRSLAGSLRVQSATASAHER